jgi:CubicO group peptidase (beta-lactamase class C family)
MDGIMIDHVLQTRSSAAVSTGRPGVLPSGFSPTRTTRLRLALQRHVDSGEVPGAVALVQHAGRVHVETLGTTAFGSDTPLRRDAIFRLASTTKPITAAASMVLVEECRLRLDDPVDDWLPELRGRRVLPTIDGPLDETAPAKRPITLRDLLTFRSGYGDFGLFAPTCPFQRALEGAGLSISTWPYRGTPDEFMRRLGELPLAHQPGERWLYHTSAEILGVLIARVSGQPFGTFLQERIFGPLAMKDTGFQVPTAAVHRLPTCYGRDMVTGALGVLDEPDGQYARPPAFESGAGGLVSTADDLLAFGRMMLGECSGEACILSRPTIELMRLDHLAPEQKASSPFFEGFWDCHGWGLGLGIVTGRAEPADVPGRFGWDGAFGTSFWMDPKERLVGVLMTQRRPDRLVRPPVIVDFWNSAYQLIDA